MGYLVYVSGSNKKVSLSESEYTSLKSSETETYTVTNTYESTFTTTNVTRTYYTTKSSSSSSASNMSSYTLSTGLTGIRKSFTLQYMDSTDNPAGSISTSTITYSRSSTYGSNTVVWFSGGFGLDSYSTVSGRTSYSSWTSSIDYRTMAFKTYANSSIYHYTEYGTLATVYSKNFSGGYAKVINSTYSISDTLKSMTVTDIIYRTSRTYQTSLSSATAKITITQTETETKTFTSTIFPNGKQRLNVLTNNGKNNVVQYGWTTDTSASTYCPIKAILTNGHTVNYEETYTTNNTYYTTTSTNTTAFTTTQSNYLYSSTTGTHSSSYTSRTACIDIDFWECTSNYQSSGTNTIASSYLSAFTSQKNQIKHYATSTVYSAFTSVDSIINWISFNCFYNTLTVTEIRSNYYAPAMMMKSNTIAMYSVNVSCNSTLNARYKADYTSYIYRSTPGVTIGNITSSTITTTSDTKTISSTRMKSSYDNKPVKAYIGKHYTSHYELSSSKTYSTTGGFTYTTTSKVTKYYTGIKSSEAITETQTKVSSRTTHTDYNLIKTYTTTSNSYNTTISTWISTTGSRSTTYTDISKTSVYSSTTYYNHNHESYARTEYANSSVTTTSTTSYTASDTMTHRTSEFWYYTFYEENLSSSVNTAFSSTTYRYQTHWESYTMANTTNTTCGYTITSYYSFGFFKVASNEISRINKTLIVYDTGIGNQTQSREGTITTYKRFTSSTYATTSTSLTTVSYKTVTLTSTSSYLTHNFNI